MAPRNDPDRYAIGCLDYIEPRFEQLKRYESDDNAHLIRYESFMTDPEHTLYVIARELGVSLTTRRTNAILEDCSLEKNQERAAAMMDFSEWNKDSLVHGNHVSTGGKIGSWQDLAATLDPKTVQVIEERTRDFLVYFKYETE